MEPKGVYFLAVMLVIAIVTNIANIFTRDINPIPNGMPLDAESSILVR